METNPKPSAKKNPLWYIGAFVLLQGKYLLALLKFSKLGGVLLSMAISVGAYAIIFPWSFSIGLVSLLLIHELGHVIAAKQKKLPVSAPLFIPFLGALITMKRNPRDAQTEAYIALGGPILGSIGALGFFIAGYMLDNELLYHLANVGFFLNLINLLPIQPLDGGRIATAVSRWLWAVGLVGGLFVIIYMRAPIFMVIWALFAWDLYQKYGRRRKNDPTTHIGGAFDLSVEELRLTGAIIPGTEHHRELPFTTYSTLDGQQVVLATWDALQFEGLIHVPRQMIIHKVKVVGVEHQQQEDGLHLKIKCQVECSPYENDRYYEVPTHVRIKFGTTYALLAVALAYMMWFTHTMTT
ncbi:Zn-dependent protease [Paenibacillus shirakamiensis]|uniref:Zn-dependent protease n=1 Tax=Paenibacillus shirakamiensis TaxID=1265935 RepID=A0ABS4JMR9_9BACL|nr:site-2 protease family protein [Paenibacillus shirakamiensis]MBP2001899.1 Zn-dependent protease [Paenibacillus shirakamiensis]